jgi:hypothetical protein
MILLHIKLVATSVSTAADLNERDGQQVIELVKAMFEKNWADIIIVKADSRFIDHELAREARMIGAQRLQCLYIRRLRKSLVSLCSIFNEHPINKNQIKIFRKIEHENKESTDKIVSLNDALREHSVAV